MSTARYGFMMREDGPEWLSREIEAAVESHAAEFDAILARFERGKRYEAQRRASTRRVKRFAEILADG